MTSKTTAETTTETTTGIPTHVTDPTELAVFDELRSVRDTLSIQRVFGEALTVDGVTIIPVARVAGGGGGGGGGGTDTDNAEGHGFGTGFGLGARPLGVYQLRDGNVVWKPTIDADRLARGGQVLAGVAMVCTMLLILRRRCPAAAD